jgi:plasmid stabilization system protein ParE
MNYSLHPGAEHDIAKALDFYSEQAGSVVAKHFLEEFERPSLGTPATRGRRTFPLKVFPYSIVYRDLESSILILIVRHQHRKPGYAGSRRQE